MGRFGEQSREVTREVLSRKQRAGSGRQQDRAAGLQEGRPQAVLVRGVGDLSPPGASPAAPSPALGQAAPAPVPPSAGEMRVFPPPAATPTPPPPRQPSVPASIPILTQSPPAGRRCAARQDGARQSPPSSSSFQLEAAPASRGLERRLQRPHLFRLLPLPLPLTCCLTPACSPLILTQQTLRGSRSLSGLRGETQTPSPAPVL